MTAEFSLADRFEALVPQLRSQFPQMSTLRSGARRIYLDNAAGTLVPERVALALADGALWGNPQPERDWPGAHETSAAHRSARALLAEFLNSGERDRIYLSDSTTAALYKLREALEPGWGPAATGSVAPNLVVTDCDHFANISPWEWRARWEVRRARMTACGGLDLDHFSSLLDSSTALAAVTMAGNGLGTIVPITRVREIIRERAPRALLVVDAVHAAPHLPIDVGQLGADALAFSTYKLFGPPCGVLWLSEALCQRLSPYHVEPHQDAETLMECGTLDNATVRGIAAALEYVQGIGVRLEPACVGQWSAYPRSRRLFKLAVAGMREYEARLSRVVLEGLAPIDQATVYGVTDVKAVGNRVPTLAFELRDRNGRVIEGLEPRFWNHGGVQLADGSHYSSAVLRALQRKKIARASFAHYNTAEDAAVFLQAARRITEE